MEFCFINKFSLFCFFMCVLCIRSLPLLCVCQCHHCSIQFQVVNSGGVFRFTVRYKLNSNCSPICYNFINSLTSLLDKLNLICNKWAGNWFAKLNKLFQLRSRATERAGEIEQTEKTISIFHLFSYSLERFTFNLNVYVLVLSVLYVHVVWIIYGRMRNCIQLQNLFCVFFTRTSSRNYVNASKLNLIFQYLYNNILCIEIYHHPSADMIKSVSVLYLFSIISVIVCAIRHNFITIQIGCQLCGTICESRRWTFPNQFTVWLTVTIEFIPFVNDNFAW